jgi:hypothetical protein
LASFPIPRNIKKTLPMYIIKLLKTAVKRKILKAARERAIKTRE